MAKVLTSKEFIEEKKFDLIRRCNTLKNNGIEPKLVVVLVGKNPASLSYVNNKKKFCVLIGAICEIINLDEKIDANEFVNSIQKLNKDPFTHGIIIQLPLPRALQSLNIQELVVPEKDVDGFHPLGTLDLYYQRSNHLLPCTPSGIMDFLVQGLKINLEKMIVCLIGRSYIVGKPMLLLLNNANATVIWCHSKTSNLSTFTKTADIIISATGKRKFLDSTFFDRNKKQIVIDVGITGGAGEPLAGDLNSDDVQHFSNLSYTPVPGGIGPLTVYKLVDNLIKACELLKK